MKCTSKLRLLCLTGVAAVFISGCTTGCGNKNTVSFANPYDIYSMTRSYGIAVGSGSSDHPWYSEDLCVTDDTNTVSDSVNSGLAEGAGIFNLATKQVTFSKNIYEKLYPASTTKILTAYLALKHGNMDDFVTVSENAANQANDSSVCELHAGDVIQMRDLLYGLMLASGNDAAIAIAEHISGNVENFVALMNEEAASMGAVRSNFVNPNGLPDDNHYTSVYDLYLIFRNAIENQTFLDILHTASYTSTFTRADGSSVQKTWDNSNRYIDGRAEAPGGFTIIGGKTGTTGAAGYCLVLYAKNGKAEPVISVVLKAGGPSDLYQLTGELLSNFGN